jgi:formylmethanofuran dehydrogenase subunit A
LTNSIVIKGGRVFDPSSGWDGAERDLFIENGRLVDRLSEVDQVIPAQGLAVTPAAIDIRSSVAAYGQNYLRLWGALPSPRQVGESYALLGYTHIHEPFLTVPTANYVHHELAAIPVVDTSASLTLNLRDFDIWLKDAQQLPEVSAAWAYLMEHSRALNLRIVEPFVRYRQEFYFHRNLPLEPMLEALWRLLEVSGSPIMLEAFPELLAADLPALPGMHLCALGPALVSADLEAKAQQHLENGVSADMGLLPPAPRPDLPHVPVKIDLDWFNPFDLNVPTDPEVSRRALHLALNGRREKLAFSAANLTQTPVNSFPLLFSWLGERTFRPHDWEKNPPGSDYTIGDWIKSTRTLPAQLLGLRDRGHLRPGARADVAIYDLSGNGGFSSWQESSGRCRLLLKAGEMVVNNFAVVNNRVAKTTYYRRTHTLPNQMVADIIAYHSFRRENLWVSPRTDVHWQQVT